MTICLLILKLFYLLINSKKKSHRTRKPHVMRLVNVTLVLNVCVQVFVLCARERM